jgi:hypothetical protein
LRRKTEGLVFCNFDERKHCISIEEARKKKFIQFVSGLDTSYSQKSPDTIAMTFGGITEEREYVYLDEEVYNNAERDIPIAPSDTAERYHAFLERNRRKWGLARQVYIDSGDQATITETAKYKRNNPCVYVFNPSYKGIKIIDRIILQQGWLHTGHYFVCDHCVHHIGEMGVYSWTDKNNVPEDGHDHTINGDQYGWIPYVSKIGIEDVKKQEEPVDLGRAMMVQRQQQRLRR